MFTQIADLALQKVFGKGKSKGAEKRRFWRERVVERAKRFAQGDVSRQALRETLRQEEYGTERPGLNRKERRMLSRALASKRFRELVAEKKESRLAWKAQEGGKR